MQSTRYQKHVEFVTEPDKSAAEGVGVHVYGVACHRMHVLSEASLCHSRPRSGQEP